VKVVHAKNLRVADRTSSDPYTIVIFPNQKEKKTSIINKCLNPIWNDLIEEQINISKDKMVAIQIIVKDHDLLNKDDLLGTAEVDWNSCIESPGQWTINNLFDLNGPPDIRGKVETLG